MTDACLALILFPEREQTLQKSFALAGMNPYSFTNSGANFHLNAFNERSCQPG